MALEWVQSASFSSLPEHTILLIAIGRSYFGVCHLPLTPVASVLINIDCRLKVSELCYTVDEGPLYQGQLLHSTNAIGRKSVHCREDIVFLIESRLHYSYLTSGGVSELSAYNSGGRPVECSSVSWTHGTPSSSETYLNSTLIVTATIHQSHCTFFTNTT